MRRFGALIGAVCLGLGLAFALPSGAAGAAGAAGLSALAGGCSDIAYPPSPHATIMASTTTPRVGETIEGSGTAYCPDEDVRLTLAGTFVGTTHTDSTGSFDPPVKVAQAGRQLLCGVGASGLPNDRDCIALVARSHGTGGEHAHKPNGGGGTSFTGVDILLLCLLAAVLLGAGWALTVVGRRKRHATVDG